MHKVETNEHAHRIVLYDHAGSVAHFWRNRTFYRRKPHREGITTRENPLEGDAFEAISLLLRLRCARLTVGDSQEFPVHEDGKNQIVEVHVEAVERIDTPLGWMDTLRVRVEIVTEGRTVTKRPIYVWISNDGRWLPLKAIAHLKFANLRAVLVGYRRNFAAEIEGKLDPDALAGGNSRPRSLDPGP